MYFDRVCAVPVVLLFTLASYDPEEHISLLRPDPAAVSRVTRDLNMAGHFAGHGQEFSLYWADRVFPVWHVLKPSFSYAMVAGLLEGVSERYILRYPFPVLEDAAALTGKLCYAFGGVAVTHEGHEDPSFALFFGPEATAQAISEHYELERTKVWGDDIIVRRDHLFERLGVLIPELVEGLPKMHASFWFPHYFYLRGMLSPPQPLKQVPLPLGTKREAERLFSRAGWEVVPCVY